MKSLKPSRKLGVAVHHSTGLHKNLRYESIAEIENENVSTYPVEQNVTDQDMEINFNAVSLSIRTEALTLNHRLEYQRRQRDLCEANLQNEIQQLGDLLHELQQEVTRSLVSTYHRTGINCESGSHFYEKFSIARKQLKILESTALRISSISENLGAVEHESRLSSAVELLIQYVDSVKRKWEKEHRELEETKKILQESGLNVQESLNTQQTKNINFNNTNTNNNSTKRRASFPAAPFRKVSLITNVVKKIQTTFITEEIPEIPPVTKEEEKFSVERLATEEKSVKNYLKVDWAKSAICDRKKGYTRRKSSARRKSSTSCRKTSMLNKFQAYLSLIIYAIWQRCTGVTPHNNNGGRRLRSGASNDLKWDMKCLLRGVRYCLACVFLFAAFSCLVITFMPSISKSIASRMLHYELWSAGTFC